MKDACLTLRCNAAGVPVGVEVGGVDVTKLLPFMQISVSALSRGCVTVHLGLALQGCRRVGPAGTVETIDVRTLLAESDQLWRRVEDKAAGGDA